MKKKTLIAWCAINIVSVAVVYFCLLFGELAQRTANYGFLKELETEQFLSTNADVIIQEGKPGYGLIKLRAIHDAHNFAVVWTLALAIVSIAVGISLVRFRPVESTEPVSRNEGKHD